MTDIMSLIMNLDVNDAMFAGYLGGIGIIYLQMTIVYNK